jgi:gamma-glutamyltranspeptidase / glutathione hydrolase
MPRSNVCPTIALDENGCPKLAIGAAGSRRIVSATLQVIRRVLGNGEDLQAALSAPRAHALLNGKAWVERSGLTGALQSRLDGRFRQVIARKQHDYKMGCVQAISWDDEHSASAAADPRRDGVGTAFELPRMET